MVWYRDPIGGGLEWEEETTPVSDMKPVRTAEAETTKQSIPTGLDIALDVVRTTQRTAVLLKRKQTAHLQFDETGNLYTVNTETSRRGD